MLEGKKYKIGQGLYDSTLFFVDHGLLIQDDFQNRIKEFTFCKKFNCPPYPSLNDTPPNIIDDFLVIEQEYNHCIEKQQRENKNA